MKILLSILCGTVILFVGGCVVSFGGDAGPIAWLSWGVVIVNLLLIAATWGLTGPLRPLFIIMGVVDLGVALVLGVVTISDSHLDPGLMAWGLAIAAAFLVKALLSFAAARRAS